MQNHILKIPLCLCAYKHKLLIINYILYIKHFYNSKNLRQVQYQTFLTSLLTRQATVSSSCRALLLELTLPKIAKDIFYNIDMCKV
jgi:hypothetical protein